MDDPRGRFEIVGVPDSTIYRFSRDSLLEERGFEPSVPLKAPGVVVVLVLARADFSVGGEASRGDISRSRNLSSRSDFPVCVLTGGPEGDEI